MAFTLQYASRHGGAKGPGIRPRCVLVSVRSQQTGVARSHSRVHAEHRGKQAAGRRTQLIWERSSVELNPVLVRLWVRVLYLERLAQEVLCPR